MAAATAAASSAPRRRRTRTAHQIDEPYRAGGGEHVDPQRVLREHAEQRDGADHGARQRREPGKPRAAHEQRQDAGEHDVVEAVQRPERHQTRARAPASAAQAHGPRTPARSRCPPAPQALRRSALPPPRAQDRGCPCNTKPSGPNVKTTSRPNCKCSSVGHRQTDPPRLVQAGRRRLRRLHDREQPHRDRDGAQEPRGARERVHRVAVRAAENRPFARSLRVDGLVQHDPARRRRRFRRVEPRAAAAGPLSRRADRRADSLKRRGSEWNLPRLAAGRVEFVHADIRRPDDLAFAGRAST